MAKYCSNCGTKLTGKYCTECGKQALSEVEEEKRKFRAEKKKFTDARFQKTHKLIDAQTDSIAWDFATRIVDYAIGSEDIYFPGKTEQVLQMANWLSCAMDAVVQTAPEGIRAAYKKWEEGTNGKRVFDR